MPREIVLGNQCLLVNIDKWLQIRDLFYPHVGEENHVQGHAHKIGVYVDGEMSWVNEDSWEREINYDKDTLISHAVAVNEELQVSLHLHDCVSCDEDVFLRKVSVKNNSDRKRHIKIFFYQDFHLYGTDIGDTAGYDAHRNSIFHYKKNRYFMINAIKEETCASCQPKGDICDYAVGKSEHKTGESTFYDAEDGELSQNPIAQGSVDSTVAVCEDIGPGGAGVFYYWITCGKDRDEIIELNDYMMEKHPDKIFDSTDRCWAGIVNSQPRDFKDLGEEVEEMYKRSILVVISNIDKNGAITAANDSDNLKFNRDTYSYCWPRDGALVAYALDKAGYHEYTKPFFEFCARVISKHGVLLHKYNPDGSLGSTWHPWVKDGEPHLPIQEDETALVLFALWYHYQQTQDHELAERMYDELVVPAADFMCRHTRDDNLPIECYDLWEEREGILTFTVSTVIAGLRAAANFCNEFGDEEKRDKYRETAESMKEAMLENLWDEEKGRFLKMLRCLPEKEEKDPTVESSTYAVFEFGVLPADDDKVVKNMEKVKEELWVNTEIGGLARYSGDNYHKVSDSVPGNPWLITTMWYGKWLIEKAKSLEELEEAKKILEWVCDNSTQSDMMPEQVHPHTGEPLSVSPLTWSHATFVDIVNDYIERYEELKN